MKKHHHAPSHRNEIVRIRKIMGQWEGIARMIEAGRYCPDILTQIKAVESAAKSLKTRILERHLNHCVTDALQKTSQSTAATKIQELKTLLKQW